jgi:Cu/Ag efflux protein CusF
MPGLLVLGLLLATSALLAQEGRQRGKIKKVDADKDTITITVGDKDLEFEVSDKTRLMDGDNKEIKDRLKDKRLKPGTPVMFIARNRDNTIVLVGMKLAGPGGSTGRPVPGDIRSAKVKKIDLDKKVLTLTVDGKDREFTLIDRTQVLGASGDTLEERFKGVKVGADILFKAVRRDGKEVIIGLKVGGRDSSGNRERPGEQERITKDTSNLKPLTELSSDLYQKFAGGLYPESKNVRPAAHEAAGLRLAKEVQPRDTKGKPAKDGKIVLLSVGMSNTSQVSTGFARAIGDEDQINPSVVFLNGAQGGMTASAIQQADSGQGEQYWKTVDERLEDAGLTREQVQAVWIKQADAGPKEGFPGYARKLQGELANIVKLLHGRFPNLKLVYLSSRTYGGYARSRLNPEPYAYESGFAVKWLIEQQIKGEAALNFDVKNGAVKAPWLSWGPYLWANGTTKRTDGFRYEEADFAPDGTHLSGSGVRKTGELMLNFFKTDSTTKTWFVRPR